MDRPTYTVQCGRTGLEGHGQTFTRAIEDLAHQRELHSQRHRSNAAPHTICVDGSGRIESQRYELPISNEQI